MLSWLINLITFAVIVAVCTMGVLLSLMFMPFILIGKLWHWAHDHRLVVPALRPPLPNMEKLNDEWLADAMKRIGKVAFDSEGGFSLN